MKLQRINGAVSTIAVTTLLAAFATTVEAQNSSDGRESEAIQPLEVITVTAQRRTERITDVPVSISAFGQDEADRRGILSIEDVARITPNLTIDNFGNTIARVAIRGVDSSAGSGTTGIYINDVPIQVRQIGFNAFDVFPLIFDMERVEVLRGPQGTLFGAGSQGGTLRFITPEPNLSEFSGYSRATLSSTKSGAPSYEAGVAFGGPISEDKVAFRASVWASEQGGWIDRVRERLDFPGTFDLVDKDANSREAYIARLDMKIAFSDNFQITPSVYFQKQKLNDSNVFWLEDTGPTALSSSFIGAYTAPLLFTDRGKSEFRAGENTQQNGEDKFLLASLKMQYDWKFARLVAVGSYFDRKQTLADDFTTFDQVLFTGIVNSAIAGVSPFGFSRPVLPGQRASSFDINEQNNYTFEVRLESGQESSERFNWVLGVFYSDAEQSAVQQVEDLFLGDVLSQQFQDLLGFGLGPDPITAFFGIPLVDGRFIFDNLEVAKDKQLAGFAQVDWEVVDNLTLTGGVRVSDTKYSIFNEVVGPVLGPFNTDYVSQSETPVTPKFAVSWKPSEGHLLYGSASKGFRIGGANAAVGLPCGITDGEPISGTALGDLGLSDRPVAFDSDNLWSYEVGTKDTFLGGRLQTNVALFHLEWKDIQQNIQLPACGFRYFGNAGNADIDGFEFEASFAPTDNLYFALAIGYAKARFTETAYATPDAAAAGAAPILSKGDHLGAPPFTLNLVAQYNFAGPFEKNYYIRFDWDHNDGPKDLPGNNPANGSYDPNFIPNPDTDFVNMRLAVQIDSGLEVALFANNLFNDLPYLNRAIQPNGTLWRAQSFRPRTLGIQGVYRF